MLDQHIQDIFQALAWAWHYQEKIWLVRGMVALQRYLPIRRWDAMAQVHWQHAEEAAHELGLDEERMAG